MSAISIETKKVTELTAFTTPTDSCLIPIHDGTGLKKITFANFRAKAVEGTEAKIAPLLFSNAGAHNAIYRGKSLGSTVTTAQYAAIKAGTFDDLYIGDYWTIGGVNYRIAAFDYYLNSGDTACTTHHTVIVPDTSLYSAAMNSTGTTAGGYVGSAMRKSKLEQAKSTIKTAFGTAHILTKREFLTNAVNSNIPSGGAWVDSDVELMNEVQAYGSVAWGAHDGNGYNVASGSGQFPLLMLDRTKMNIQKSYWLRDVSSGSKFSMVAADGVTGYGNASISLGVRPYFCIY